VKCVEGDGELLEILIEYISSGIKMNLAQYSGMETDEEVVGAYRETHRSICESPYRVLRGVSANGIWLEQTNISSADINNYLWNGTKVKIDPKCDSKQAKDIEEAEVRYRDVRKSLWRHFQFRIEVKIRE
jgi:hypothetical protein